MSDIKAVHVAVSAHSEALVYTSLRKDAIAHKEVSVCVCVAVGHDSGGTERIVESSPIRCWCVLARQEREGWLCLVGEVSRRVTWLALPCLGQH